MLVFRGVFFGLVLFCFSFQGLHSREGDSLGRVDCRNNRSYWDVDLLRDNSKNLKKKDSDYFIIFLVDARHLDYSNSKTLLKTIAKHSNGSKQGDVGHSWVYLHGWEGEKEVIIEGGHSGEIGEDEFSYALGVQNYVTYGRANPTEEEKKNPIYEPNPIKYLWVTLKDGYFEKGASFHKPTFAARVDLTKRQFLKIKKFIKQEYNYSRYSLIDHQCTNFIVELASLVHCSLKHKVEIPEKKEMRIMWKRIHFWEDPKYSVLTLSSPDVLEKSLMELVQRGKAKNALQWYRKRNRNSFSSKVSKGWKTITKFPGRFMKWVLL